jgi:hypothetical protein
MENDQIASLGETVMFNNARVVLFVKVGYEKVRDKKVGDEVGDKNRASDIPYVYGEGIEAKPFYFILLFILIARRN